MVSNRRGSGADITYMIIFLAGLAVVAVLGAFINAEVSQGFRDAGVLTPVAEEAINSTEQAISDGLLDNVFLIIFAGMILSIVILAFMINVNPAFIVVYIIVTIINVLVSIPIANFYYEFKTNAILAGTASGFTIQNYIMSNLPITIFLISLLVGIVTYGKMASSQGGGI